MKRLSVFIVCVLVFSLSGKTQQNRGSSDTTEVVLENDRLKVVSYTSTPGKDVCGKGMHSHSPHLTIFLTDAHVKLTTKDGKTQDVDLKTGTTLWTETDTHMVVNNGSNAVQVYLVEVI